MVVKNNMTKMSEKFEKKIKSAPISGNAPITKLVDEIIRIFENTFNLIEIKKGMDTEMVPCQLKQANVPLHAGICKTKIFTRRRGSKILFEFDKKISKCNPIKFSSFANFLRNLIVESKFGKIDVFTYFPMKNNRRSNLNAYVEHNTAYFTCIDIDFKNNSSIEIKNWIDTKLPILINFLRNYPNSFAIQKSKSGKGLHIYLLIYVGKPSSKDNNMGGVNLLFELLKDFSKLIDADTTIYDKARYIFPSPYSVFLFPRNNKLAEISNLYSYVKNFIIDIYDNYENILSTSLRFSLGNKNNNYSSCNLVPTDVTCSKIHDDKLPINHSNLSRSTFSIVQLHSSFIVSNIDGLHTNYTATDNINICDAEFNHNIVNNNNILNGINNTYKLDIIEDIYISPSRFSLGKTNRMFNSASVSSLHLSDIINRIAGVSVINISTHEKLVKLDQINIKNNVVSLHVPNISTDYNCKINKCVALFRTKNVVKNKTINLGINEYDEKIANFYMKKQDKFENITLKELLNDVKNLPPYQFKLKYGEIRVARENIFKILAHEMVRRGIIKNTNEFIQWNNGKKRYVNICVSPNERTKYDMFTYVDTDCIWFQSTNALRHLGFLGYFVEGAKLVDEKIDEETGEITYIYELTTTSNGKKVKNPGIAPYYFGYLFITIAGNYGIYIPDWFGIEFAKKYSSYFGILPVKFISQKLMEMINDALSSPEKAVPISDYISEYFRRGGRAKIWYTIKKYIEENFSDLIQFKRIGNKQCLVITDEFVKQMNLIRTNKKARIAIKMNANLHRMKNNTITGLFGYLINLFYIIDRDFEGKFSEIIEFAEEKCNFLFEIFNFFGGVDIFVLKAYREYGRIRNDIEKILKEYLLLRYIAGYLIMRYKIEELNKPISITSNYNDDYT